jgi:hypothetical protein
MTEAELLADFETNRAGFEPTVPSIPAAVTDHDHVVTTVPDYAAAFEELLAGYQAFGLTAEREVRDLDANGLSDTLLDLTQSGLTGVEYVAFWEAFDGDAALAGMDNAEGDFKAVLDASLVTEHDFAAALAQRGYSMQSFCARLGAAAQWPEDLLATAAHHAGDSGALIDAVMSGFAQGEAVVVPLTPAAGTDALGRSAPGAQWLGAAWALLGQMSNVSATVDLLQRILAGGANPYRDRQLAMDGGVAPAGATESPGGRGRYGSWPYEAKAYRFWSWGRQVLSGIELDVDTWSCAQYLDAPGRFTNNWRLYLWARAGNPQVLLEPSQLANAGTWSDGRDTGDPKDILQVSLERVGLTISHASGSTTDHWGGTHRHLLDLIITGDGWVYLLSAHPRLDEHGRRVTPDNLAVLKYQQTAYGCKATPGKDPNDDCDIRKDLPAPPGALAPASGSADGDMADAAALRPDSRAPAPAGAPALGGVAGAPVLVRPGCATLAIAGESSTAARKRSSISSSGSPASLGDEPESAA